MKKLFFLLCVLSFGFSEVSNEEILREVKSIKIDLTEVKKDISELKTEIAVIKAEQESMNQRFDIVMNILYIMLAAVFGSPFLAHYLSNKNNQQQLNEMKQLREKTEAMMTVFRSMASNDEKIAEKLKAAGLL